MECRVVYRGLTDQCFGETVPLHLLKLLYQLYGLEQLHGRRQCLGFVVDVRCYRGLNDL